MQDNNLYRELILEHWKNPQNYGVLEPADIDATDVNPLCGDEIRITANIKNKNITEIAFTSIGCAISKASASLFTEEVKRKSIEEIKNIKPQDVLNLLEISLTPTRTKCALLVHGVLKKAIR